VASLFMTCAAPFMTCEIFSRALRSWMPTLVTPIGHGELPGVQCGASLHASQLALQWCRSAAAIHRQTYADWCCYLDWPLLKLHRFILGGSCASTHAHHKCAASSRQSTC